MAIQKDSYMSKLFHAGLAAATMAAMLGSSPASAAGREVTVAMANMKYGAIPGDLKVGDSIIFVNKDSVPHTVTARNRSFDLRIGPNQRGKLTLSKAGTFSIYCIIHPPMRGSFSVAAK
jgi:plastocyanin